MPKGRDKHLIDNRNKALLRRYYHWTEVKRLRFDDALKILSEQEFFISEERILTIIREYRNIDETVPAVPKVRMPRLTLNQLSLFTDDSGFQVSQIHRDSKI
jgi:hypothetical protein